MAPFDTLLITNTVSRVPLLFIKNRSTPASAAAIPNWPELSLPVQVMECLCPRFLPRRVPPATPCQPRARSRIVPRNRSVRIRLPVRFWLQLSSRLRQEL